MEKKKIEILEDLDVISEDIELAFPLYEFKNRLNKTRAKMQEKGIDVLYITMPESIYYISGLRLNWYSTNSSPMWDSRKAMGIAIHVDYDDYIQFSIPDEAQTIMGATCTKAENLKIIADVPGDVYQFGKKIDSVQPGQLPLELIIKGLKDEGWLNNTTVAMEKGSPRPNWKTGQILADGFVSAGAKEVVDGTDILLELRGKKSPLELNYIEKASVLADIGHQAIMDGTYEGMTERDFVSLYTDAMFAAGGESMAIVDQVGFGKGKAWWVHSPASRKKLMRGDPIRVDLCGVYNRYHSNQARNYSFGTPEKSLVEDCRRGALVMNRVSEILETNMYINDFWDQIKDFMKKEGMWGDQYWLGGYEIGIAFPPDWCGNFVYDSFVDMKDARFEEGMVVNFECGFGVVDTLMFKKDEAKILGNTPWKLQIIDPDGGGAYEAE